MTAEIYLNREQEDKFFTVYREHGFTCTNEELVQRLFNEALDAAYRHVMRSGLTIEADEDDYLTDEERAEIMAELMESEES